MVRETRAAKRGEDSVFGHKWESARGTVVETLIEQTTVDGMPGLHQVPVYVLDVPKPSGEHVRAQVKGVPGMSTDLAAGTLISVEVNAKTGELRFSPDHIKASLATARSTTRVRVERTGNGVTTVTGGQPGMPGIQVVAGEQAAELMQALRAGGIDRAAAREKIRQLRVQIQAQSGGIEGQAGGIQDQIAGLQGQVGGLQGQAEALHTLAAHLQAQADRLDQGGRAGPGGSVGFSSPDAPSTFDPVTPGGPAMPAATFSSPADAFGTPTSSVGAPGGSVSFSSPPVPPPSFDPASPADTGAGSLSADSFSAGSFSAGSFSAGSFNTGGSFSSFGEDSKADRIARLADQRDHGQLTEQQFQAQRQQIMDEI
jgi:hypothetical protein